MAIALPSYRSSDTDAISAAIYSIELLYIRVQRGENSYLVVVDDEK